MAIIFLPSLLYYFGASSLGMGTFAAAPVIVVMSMYRRHRRFTAPITAGACYILLVMLVLIHGVIAQAIVATDVARMLSSLAPLLAMIAGGFAFGNLLLSSQKTEISKACKIVFFLMMITAFFSLLNLSPQGARQFQKPLFPFTEPSHFGLAFTPLLLFQTATTRGISRALYLAVGLSIALILQNMTILVATIMAIAILLPPRYVALIVAAAVTAASQLDLIYYAQRLDFSGESAQMESLSSLVYLQGWQLVGESLERSHGWGLGFQQLGVLGTNVNAGQLIYGLMGDYLNLFDGAFTASKILSEFGAIGAPILIFLLIQIGKSILELRAFAQGSIMQQGEITFINCSIVAMPIELFIRGAGYFTTGNLLLVSALYVISVKRWMNRRSIRCAPQSRVATTRLQKSGNNI